MPSTDNSMDAVISAEVAKMKAGFAPRSLMVQRVAEIMFDEWGEKPSANKVYEHVRQGSITDINRDLKQFWDGLRKRKAGTMEIAGIPSHLALESAELLKSMWVTALNHATKTFDADKLSFKQVTDDLTGQVIQLQLALDAITESAENLRLTNNGLTQQVKDQAITIAEYEDSLNAVNDEKRLLKADKDELQRQAVIQENSHIEAIRNLANSHQAEIESLRRDLKFFQLEKDRATTRRDQIQAEAIEAKKLLDMTISALQDTIANERSTHIRIQNAWATQSQSLEDRIQRLDRELNRAKQGFNNYGQLTSVPYYLSYTIKYD